MSSIVTGLRLIVGDADRDPVTEAVARCACGSGWFELRDNVLAPRGAVSLDLRGQVVAHLGDPVCLLCGRAWQPISTVNHCQVYESQAASTGTHDVVACVHDDSDEDVLSTCSLIALHFGVRLSDAPDHDRPSIFDQLDAAVGEALRVRHPNMSAEVAERVRATANKHAARVCAQLSRDASEPKRAAGP